MIHNYLAYCLTATLLKAFLLSYILNSIDGFIPTSLTIRNQDAAMATHPKKSNNIPAKNGKTHRTKHNGQSHPPKPAAAVTKHQSS